MCNRLDELARLATWIRQLGDAWGIPEPLLMKLNLVLEEWLVNVISYAYADNSDHTIEVRVWRREDELQLEIEDDGRPFDPTAQAGADTSLPLEHRQIGGLGIHFVRTIVDRFTYRLPCAGQKKTAYRQCPESRRRRRGLRRRGNSSPLP